MVAVAVREQTDVAQARRVATALAKNVGGNEEGCGNVAIVATELAGNMLRHAGGGEILLQPWDDCVDVGVEVFALDSGPGMADVAKCLRDGYSTGGTPGTGLGAVARLSTVFDVWSRPRRGTVLLARVPLSKSKAAPIAPPCSWGTVVVPKTGEEVCGDAWGVVFDARRMAFLVVDGLGHGSAAATAAHTAVDVFDRHAPKESPGGAMQAIHRGLASTRGAAAAIAELRLAQGEMVFCGVGNIATTLFSDGMARKAVSMSGTLGHVARTVREFSYPIGSSFVLVMASDGLHTNWSIDAYAGLLTHHPALIAGVLYRDLKRGRDDATVLVARGRSS